MKLSTLNIQFYNFQSLFLKINKIVSYHFKIIDFERHFLMVFENYIVTGFKRRQKNINEVENKSQRLRNERKIEESKKFEEHALFLKEELGRYFQQYRELLINNGKIPIHRVGIPALTKKELQIVDKYNSTHRQFV